ncbi:MAG: PHP domain-containing protein [Verrucomicrobiota bacterium]
MPKYRIDLHTHSHYSVDGVSDPYAMVESARAKGLAGFVLTDHDTCRGVDFFLGEGLMREDGIPVDDFLIIPGQEVSTWEGHVLAIGVRLESQPGIHCEELVEMVHGLGGLCVAAHPFDPARRGVGKNVLDEVAFDGIEVFNAASWFPGLNGRAFRYAKKHNSVMTAGSDSHHPDALGRAHMILELPELQRSLVLDAIKRGKGQREERLLRPIDYVIKNWYNIVRPKVPDAESNCERVLES